MHTIKVAPLSSAAELTFNGFMRSRFSDENEDMLKISNVYLASSWLVLFILPFNLVYAQKSNSPEQLALLEEVRTELRKACTLNPVWLKYRLTEFRSAEYLIALGEQNAAENIDQNLAIDIEYAVKDIKKAYRKIGSKAGAAVEKGQATGLLRAAVFNGTQAITTDFRSDDVKPDSTVYFISQKPALVGKPALPTFLSFQEVLLLQLESLRDKESDVQIKINDGPSTNELELQFLYPNNEVCRYWLDRKLKSAVLKCEHVPSQRVRTVSHTTYALVNGQPFPSKVEWTQFLDSSPTPSWKQTCTLQTVEFQAASIPDALFEMPIPASATIYDKDKNAWRR